MFNKSTAKNDKILLYGRKVMWKTIFFVQHDVIFNISQMQHGPQNSILRPLPTRYNFDTSTTVQTLVNMLTLYYSLHFSDIKVESTGFFSLDEYLKFKFRFHYI